METGLNFLAKFYWRSSHFRGENVLTRSLFQTYHGTFSILLSRVEIGSTVSDIIYKFSQNIANSDPML